MSPAAQIPNIGTLNCKRISRLQLRQKSAASKFNVNQRPSGGLVFIKVQRTLRRHPVLFSSSAAAGIVVCDEKGKLRLEFATSSPVMDALGSSKINVAEMVTKSKA